MVVQVTRLRGLPEPPGATDTDRRETRMTPFSLEEIMRGTRYHQAGHATTGTASLA
jgi:hypothetical protein